jgi:dienelactone hydrolase
MFKLFSDNDDWSIQALRLIAEGQFGGADINECVRTAGRIGERRDVDSWSEEWARTASDVAGWGRAEQNKDHALTAQQALFRAFNYYRTADFFLDPSDPRKRELYGEGVECFSDAARSHVPAIEPVAIPYEGAVLTGYFCHADGAGIEPGPAVLYLGGADSWAEELFFLGGNQITTRGMNLLIVDTPGRGSALRLHNLVSRYDYEVPVRACIDYLCSRKDVDATRLGLMGVSMGGYYAPRAAAFEPRVKALCAWSGCWNILNDIYDHYPPIQKQLQWVVGARDDADAQKRLATFTLEGVADRIACPTLITHGEDDFIMAVEGAQRLFEALRCPKEFRLWRREEGGSVHLSYDNISIVVPFMADWMKDRLA